MRLERRDSLRRDQSAHLTGRDDKIVWNHNTEYRRPKAESWIMQIHGILCDGRVRDRNQSTVPGLALVKDTSCKDRRCLPVEAKSDRPTFITI